MKKAVCVLAVVCALIFASVSQAGVVVYVDVNGPNDPGTGSFEDPFRKIQDAIDYANDYDIIEIQPGLYTGEKNYDLDPNGKSITIQSVNPSDSTVVTSTIIDPNGAGRGFYFDSGEDANCLIAGLTIRNGHTGGRGGGIYCYSSSPTITNCIISDNSSGTHGGGIFCLDSSPQIIGCVISGNTSANDGGGIEHWRGKSTIINCIISDNQANGIGGGADYFDSNDITLTNCTFVKNSADSGGGLYSWGSNVSVKNSILWANEATQGPQIALGPSSSILIDYSNVQGGTSAVYDPCDTVSWDSGNMDVDPCFASFDANWAPNLWDFHLKSSAGQWDNGVCGIDFNKDRIVNLLDFAVLSNSWQWEEMNLPADLYRDGKVDMLDLFIFTDNYLTVHFPEVWVFDDVTSPCIDAGDPNSEWDGELWPNGKRINMGAYGGTNQASKNGNIADFDVSGMVNLTDLMEFASKWLDEEDCIVNLDLTGRVNFADFVLFSKNWLWQKE